MTFNPSKCKFICVSHKSIQGFVTISYIQDHLIKAATQVKYLRTVGVTIDERSFFNKHVAHKVNTVKAFLQRNIKSCPLQVKENCSIMVRPSSHGFKICLHNLVPLYKRKSSQIY